MMRCSLIRHPLKTLSLIGLTLVGMFELPLTAEAGPLLNWLRGRHACRQPAFQPTMPMAAASPTAVCQVTMMQTCHRTVVNYVPHTAYRTTWEAVPVTTYRPVTSTDPITGCTVTCMQPQTTTTFRAKQVPYTTYRPVFRQEAYQVPVTVTTQMPVAQTMPMAGVGCGVPGMNGLAMSQPMTGVPSITGTLDTNGSFSTMPQTTMPQTTGPVSPADTRPSLDPQMQQRPIIIEQQPPIYSNGNGSGIQNGNGNGGSMQMNSYQNSTRWPSQSNRPDATAWPGESNVNPVRDPRPESQWQSDPPQLVFPDDKTAQSPVFEQFDYSPVRLVSHVQPIDQGSSQWSTAPQPDRSSGFEGTVQRRTPSHGYSQPSPVSSQQPVNQGWRSAPQR